MATERWVLCGGAAAPPGKPPAPPIRLDRYRPTINVRLHLDGVRRALWADFPPAVQDLLDVAAYVTAADQAVTRADGGRVVGPELGAGWRRAFRFRIAVREPDRWAAEPVCRALTSTLSFLSDDEYAFEFVALPRDPNPPDFISFDHTPFEGAVAEVLAFSGGLDSLAGAAEAVAAGRQVLLVNHRSTSKTVARYECLVAQLCARAGTRPTLHFPVWADRSTSVGKEYTQRTRSFLVAALGCAFARMVGLSAFRFYENGVTGLNLPPSPQVLGARATRTTHPKVLAGFTELFTAVLGAPFAVENPYRWDTKADVVRWIARAGCAGLIAESRSCAQTIALKSTKHGHCGVCSQCIDRRFAVLAAGLADHDPAPDYAVDLLVGDRGPGTRGRNSPGTWSWSTESTRWGVGVPVALRGTGPRCRTWGDPAVVRGADLCAAVRHVGAAVLIARYARPKERHALVLLIANLLARAGWDDDRVVTFAAAVFDARNDPDKAAKVRTGEGAGAAADARKRLQSGKPMTGLPALRAMLDPARPSMIATRRGLRLIVQFPLFVAIFPRNGLPQCDNRVVSPRLGWATKPMRIRHCLQTLTVLALVPALATSRGLAADPPAFAVSKDVQAVLTAHCADCHGADNQKGDVRLDQLPSLTLDARLELLNRVQEQLFTGEMPPKKKKPPTEDERTLLMDWIGKELRTHGASKLEDKLRKPEFGNVVDHDKLFSGKYKDLPGSTPDRRWLISEYIFDAKFNNLLDLNSSRTIDKKRYTVLGGSDRNANPRVNLTNPFLLPLNSGVRYYDTTILDGGHFLTMLTNAKEASAYLMAVAERKKGLPAVAAIMAREWEQKKILAARETYLAAHIEAMLRDVFQGKHEALLPKFVASKPAPPAPSVGPDGKPLKIPVFDIASPGNAELATIWLTLRKHDTGGQSDEALIEKCERDWFHSGLAPRALQIRVAFLRGYLGELRKRMPAQLPAPPRPLADSEMAILRAALLKHRQNGDTYSAVIAKCKAEWSDGFRREREKVVTTDAAVEQLVEELFTRILERSPSPGEKSDYAALAKGYIRTIGNEKASERLIQTLILRTDFVYRSEFGEGKADEHGRKMLSPRDASYALAYALTDSSPDKELRDAAANGRLNTRDDYRREVERMLKVRSQYYLIDEAVEKIGLNDSFTNLPIRKLRFFREFFGYPAMLSIFKDNKRFGGNYTDASARLVSEADMLVEHILKQDTDVFQKLLTTEEFYVYHTGDSAAMAAGSKRYKDFYDYFKDKNWQQFDADQLKAHAPFIKEHPIPGIDADKIGVNAGRTNTLRSFKDAMTSLSERLGNGQTATAPFSTHFGAASTAATRTGRDLRGSEVAKSFNFDMSNWNYPATQPAKVEHRKGILTHPAWLIAFAGNTATDPVRRGKWVREKLLAGTVPDVPVTVDAVVPEDHTKTLRSRLAKVTEVAYCWKCHERMNPLGNSFEMFDDFGRFRTAEALEHPDNLLKKVPDKGRPQHDLRDVYKTLPIDARGVLTGTGDAKLDGEVRDAIDLTERLAKSARVRQSIVRHAFRYFLGRNEVLSDSKTLMDADRAYVESGGSFDAVIVSLLTSDSFIYRKP